MTLRVFSSFIAVSMALSGPFGLAESRGQTHSIALLFRKDGRLFLGPLFEKSDSGWQASSHGTSESPPPAPFTITYDGRIIGRTRERFGSLHKIIPTTLEKTIRFSADEQLRRLDRTRPYVATRSSVFSDPDRWRLDPAPSKTLARIRRSWSRYLNPMIFMDDQKKAKRLGAEGTRPLEKIREESLEVVKAYKDKSGRRLVGVVADRKTSAPEGWSWNEGDDDAGAMGVNWFLVDADAKIHFLKDGFLLDIGDYDGDGESEYLFYQDPGEDNRVLGVFRLVEADLQGEATAGLIWNNQEN